MFAKARAFFDKEGGLARQIAEPTPGLEPGTGGLQNRARSCTDRHRRASTPQIRVVVTAARSDRRVPVQQ